MNKKSIKGFTLAEMLIVVAIIGVLISILVPAFEKKIEKAKIATDEANLRQAYEAAMAEVLTTGKDAVYIVKMSAKKKVNKATADYDLKIQGEVSSPTSSVYRTIGGQLYLHNSYYNYKYVEVAISSGNSKSFTSAGFGKVRYAFIKDLNSLQSDWSASVMSNETKTYVLFK